MKTLLITNLSYHGHDFCGEISAEQAEIIFASQPKSLTIETSDEEYDDYVSNFSVEQLVEDWCYENGVLNPTSFDLEIL